MREIPEPFIFNPFKHHLHYIRQFICTPAPKVHEIKRIGASQMDIYEGSLSVEEILESVNEILDKWNLHSYDSFSDFIGEKGYREMEIVDGSIWVLRKGQDTKRFVHLHPGRYSPHTFRLKAHTLKTVILYIIENGWQLELGKVNEIRSSLDLPPVRSIDPKSGIGKMIFKLAGQ